MKEWCPNLLEEFGYKEWSAETATRVQKWIDIVLAGNDPKTYDPAIASAANAGTTESKTEDSPKTETDAPAPAASDPFPATTEESTDDLPF